jgi:hypothetical protein
MIPPRRSERLFTEEELDLLATPRSILLERAALARDEGAARAVIPDIDIETLAIYDAYMNWMGVLQTLILDRCGEREHDDALRWSAEHAARPFVERLRGAGPRGWAQWLASRLRSSGTTFRVEEDDARIRFRCDPWGPLRQWRAPAGWEGSEPRRREGDRIVYPSYGHYDSSAEFRLLSGARPLTHGRASLPSLLAAEILFLEIHPAELFGFPLAVIELGESLDEPVCLDVHKDPGTIPAGAYERFGMVKPAAGTLVATAGAAFSAEELRRLGMPLSLQVEEAVGEGDWNRLLAMSAGMDAELVNAKDPLGIQIAALLTWIARHLGEAEAERALERTAEVVMTPFLEWVRDLPIRDVIQVWAIAWRSHGSTFWIEEDDRRLVLRGRPLGACHRMWSHAYQHEVERISESRVRYPTFGCYDPPGSFHLMQEPRGITYGRTGYPIYSCHCHMLHEIFPIDRLGRPLWIEEHPLHDPDGETVHIHYKNPADWPERYYERVGRTKPVASG